MVVHKVEFAIIGAGPTGLGAAWRLNELSHDSWLLIDADKSAGGLAASVIDENGFVWDKGGHVLFSHYDYFDDALNNCMGDNWVQHERQAWVWMRDQFIPYPLQNNIWRLPPGDLTSCIDGLLAIHNKTVTSSTADTFEDWILANFGQGLADVFFLPYNYKVWAYPSKLMSACWMQERVAKVDLSRILHNLVQRKDDLGWGPNSTFRFPKHGGTGRIWQSMMERLPKDRFLLGNAVTCIQSDDRVITLSDDTKIEYKYLLSTMPIDKLIGITQGVPRFQDDLKQFLYSSTNLIGVGLRGQPPDFLKSKSWVYFVEDDIPFYRLTVFSNYSRFNVPQPGEQWSLLCEISESKVKTVDGANLKKDVLAALASIGFISSDACIDSVWQTRIEYGYPTPFLARDESLGRINQELLKSNIFSRGRFGGWKYEVSNQDHSFMQGVEFIDHVLFDADEITYHCPAIVNAGKRINERRIGVSGTS
jgi:protoporphyrinogen oxidase